MGSIFCASADTKADIERAFVSYGGRLRPESGGPAVGGLARAVSAQVVFIASTAEDVARAQAVIRKAQPNTLERQAAVVMVAWLASCIKGMKLLSPIAFLASD